MSDRKLLQASSPTVVARALARSAQFLFLLAAARLLTLDEFAIYSYILGLAATFSLLADSGVPTVSSREVASGRHPTAAVFWSGLPAVGLGALLAAAGLVTFGVVDSGPGSSGLLLLVAAAFAAANTFFNYLAAILRGIGRFQLEAAMQIGGAAVAVGGGIAVAAAGGSVTAVVGVFCLKEIVFTGLAYLALHGDVSPVIRPRSGLMSRLFRAGIGLAVAGMAIAIVTRLPLLMLGNAGSSEELAWFSAPVRVADTVFVLAFVGGFALLPGVTYLRATDRPRAVRLIGRVGLVAGGASLVFGVVGAAIAGSIIELLFGSDFGPASQPGRILIAGLPAYVLLGLSWHGLIAFEHERDVVLVGATGVIASILLSFLLIPTARDVGAAWSYVLAVTIMALACIGMLMYRISDGRRLAGEGRHLHGRAFDEDSGGQKR